MPLRTIEQILDIPILQGETDQPRWTLSKNGNFTLSSAWNLLRSRRPEIPGLKDIWHKGITNSMSIFTWRLISNRISVDAKLQWRRISLASKCVCCMVSPKIETLAHLFIRGEGASKVWEAFDPWFGGVGYPLRHTDPVPARMEIWAKRMKISAKMHLSRIMPCLIFWFLWSERNNCKHNETKFQGRNVIWQVQMHIHNLISKNTLCDNNWKGCIIPFLDRTRVDHRRTHCRPEIIKWSPPEPPWIKINIKGTFIPSTEQAAGGGLIRDTKRLTLTCHKLTLTCKRLFMAS